MSNWVLVHHGIKGQKWGIRNGPPYPIDISDHSASEKNAGWRSSLKASGKTTGGAGDKQRSIDISDRQKKILKIGAAAVATSLVAYGGYSLYKSGALDQFVKAGNNSTIDILGLPERLGGVANPNEYKDNCKDVAEATLKRWLGVDAGAVAGENTVAGNLHDFVKQRGYNKSGVIWISEETDGVAADPSGDSTARVTRQILRKFKDGDCGMIGVTWDPRYLVDPDNENKPDGHAFNWFIANGKVIFTDDQPDPPLTDASKHLRKTHPGKQIEIVKITKEAFAN